MRLVVNYSEFHISIDNEVHLFEFYPTHTQALKVFQSIEFDSNNDKELITYELSLIELEFNRLAKSFNFPSGYNYTLFSYEIEQVYAALRINLLRLSRFLQKNKYKRITFYLDKSSLEFQFLTSTDIHSYLNIEKSTEILFKQVKKYHGFSLSERIMRFQQKLDAGFKYIKGLSSTKKYIFSSTVRRAESLYAELPISEVGILRSRIARTKSVEEIPHYQNLIKECLSIFIVKEYLAYVDWFNDFVDCHERYIETYKPDFFFTVNVATTEEYLRSVVFKNAGVKVFMLSEGLLYPSGNVEEFFESTFKPSFNITRLTFNHGLGQYYSRKGSCPVVHSGWLGVLPVLNNEQTERRDELGVLIALAKASIHWRRHGESEDIFEMVKFIDDCIEAVERTNLKDKNIILKLHPSDFNLFYFLNSNPRYSSVRIEMQNSIYDLLNSVDNVILYASSVASEALIMGKRVIYYNYISTASYTDSFIQDINENFPGQSQLRAAYHVNDIIDILQDNTWQNDLAKPLYEEINPGNFLESLEDILINA